MKTMTFFKLNSRNKYFWVQPAQDRSPYCIFHIMNKILQHPEIIDTFLVGNH